MAAGLRAGKDPRREKLREVRRRGGKRSVYRPRRCDCTWCQLGREARREGGTRRDRAIGRQENYEKEG